MDVHTLIVGLLETNCYLVSDPETKQALIIDPGGETSEILPAVERLELGVRAIVLTHGHGDHSWSAAALREETGAPVLIHRLDAALLKEPELSGAALAGLDPASCVPDRFLEEGETLTLGDCAIALQVLHTPGHTPGSISLLGETCVFVGDCLFASSIGRTDLPGSSDREMFHSLRRLLSLDDALTVYPGHGPPTTIGMERQTNPFLVQLGLV